MPWPLFMVAHDDSDAWEKRDTPGACWTMETFLEPQNRHRLSPEYLRDWDGKRPPLMICTPDGNWWMVDCLSSNGVSGWTITGEPPNLTAHPSIGSSDYHGWLKDGVLSDDLEGRSYSQHPKREPGQMRGGAV